MSMGDILPMNCAIHGKYTADIPTEGFNKSCPKCVGKSVNESVQEPIKQIQGDFVSLAEQVNQYISENIQGFSLPLSRDELNLQFEDSVRTEEMFPMIVVGSGKDVKAEEAFSALKKIKEHFGFKTKIIMTHGSPVSNIKSSMEIHFSESNPMILLNVEFLEGGYAITLNYNSTIDGKVRNILEHVEPVIFLSEEEDALLEGALSKSRYNSAFDKFALIMKMQNISTLNLVDTFDQSYIDMMTRRFEVLNKKGGSFYTAYRNSYEQEMLMRHFIKVYNQLAVNKAASKLTPMFSILFHKGKAYPLLVVGSNAMNRIVGVYAFTMEPKDAEDGSYMIGKAELFRSPITALNMDVLFLRKALGALYFK